MSRAPRKLRIDLAYDGTDFSGWQQQPARRTVQGVLETTLTRICGGEPVAVRGAGRTDAGVHARGQVADLDFPASMPDADLAYALRRMLPADVRPTRVATVDEAFDARRDAVLKTYAYRLDLSPAGDPFRRRYALHCPHELDPERLRRGLALLPGRRDWSGFVGAVCRIEDRVRTLTTARLDGGSDDAVSLVFEADGFLTYMVRNVVGTLLEIARGRLPSERIEQILASRDRSLAGPTAPARGLTLERVVYPV